MTAIRIRSSITFSRRIIASTARPRHQRSISPGFSRMSRALARKMLASIRSARTFWPVPPRVTLPSCACARTLPMASIISVGRPPHLIRVRPSPAFIIRRGKPRRSALAVWRESSPPSGRCNGHRAWASPKKGAAAARCSILMGKSLASFMGVNPLASIQPALITTVVSTGRSTRFRGG